MEAFGAVVNICSFIDLSTKVITKLNKYITEVKSAEKSRQRFAEELHRIVVILKSFESLVNQLDQQASPQSKGQLEALRSFFKKISPQTQNLYEELESLSEWLDKETRVQGHGLLAENEVALEWQEDRDDASRVVKAYRDIQLGIIC